MKIKLERNNEGSLIVKSPNDLGLLADFLETDINDNLDYCQDILDAISHNEKNTSKNYIESFCGNLYELEITSNHALLHNLHDESVTPVKIENHELTELLSLWKDELAKDSS